MFGSRVRLKTFDSNTPALSETAQYITERERFGFPDVYFFILFKMIKSWDLVLLSCRIFHMLVVSLTSADAIKASPTLILLSPFVPQLESGTPTWL